MWTGWEWRSSSAGRASDRHTAEAVPFPGAARDFSPKVNCQRRLLRCPYTPVCNRIYYICAHVKDPVVHVRAQCIMKTLKITACTVNWLTRLWRSWLSQGKKEQPEFHVGESHLDNTVVKSKNKKDKYYYQETEASVIICT